SPRHTAEGLLMHALGTDRAALYADRTGVSADALQTFARTLWRRGRGTPVQYLTGEQQFRDLRLTVGPGVLIPRPETEGLVDAVLDVMLAPSPIVADVGTGSGAIALAIKHERPTARVLGTDLS